MTSTLRQHRSPAGFRWPRRTLWDDVARHAVERPGATAVSDGDGGYSYRWLVDSTLLLSGRYRQMGVRHGDVVIVQMHGVRQFVPAFLAAERLGAVVSPILPAIDGKAFGEIVDLACPALVVTANDPDTLEGTGVTPVVSVAPSGSGPRLDELLAGSDPGGGLPDPPAPHDLSELAFTSGTTDRPKGVLHTHATATAGILSTISRQGIDASDVVHVALPVGHNFGYFYGVRLGLHAGAHVVLQARWNPDRMLEACARYGVTVSSGPPAFLVDLLGYRSKWRGRLDSLRLFTCAGAKLAPDTAREVVDKLPGRMSKAFGMTELGHVCSTTAGAPTDKLLETEGHPHPEIQMRVLGPGGVWLRREQEGEIAFRGPFLMVGYHGGGSPEAIDEDGFFRTGDLGYTDRDGYLVITGRVKNMVIRGGENIPAERVERALAGHELLRDAAVVGVPDRRLGERPVACVQARPGFVPRPQTWPNSSSAPGSLRSTARRPLWWSRRYRAAQPARYVGPTSAGWRAASPPSSRGAAMADSPVVAIEHVGIAVRDAETAKNRYRTMGFVDVRTEDLPGGIRSHLLRSGTAYVEILESTRDGSDLARFLARRGEGLHHLCLRVDSLAEATSVAESAGCGLVSGIPIEDVRGSRVFIHPATNDGVLTGLVEPHAVGCEAEPAPG